MPDMVHSIAIATGPSGQTSRGFDQTEQKARNIHHAAQKLEATFLAEMLKSAGFGKQRDSFGGGAGEEQFSSFLVQAQSEAMVRAGGVGLTETFVKALMEAEK